MAKGILRLQLGAPLQMPRRRFVRLLEEVAVDCNRARNAMTRMVVNWIYDQSDDDTRKKFMTELKTKPYHFGRTIAPKVNSNAISMCANEVFTRLKSRVPYTHEGPSRWVWQAIHQYELQPSTYRGLSIPIHNRTLRLVYTGDANAHVDNETAKMGESSCVVQFALLSKDSGYTARSPVVRVEARQLSGGNRELLRKIAQREIKARDSRIVYDKGKWCLNLVYEVDRSLDLPKDRTLIIEPNGSNQQSPFIAHFPGGGKRYLGNGAALAYIHRRVLQRRKAIKFNYRDGMGSGHGKQRFFQATRPISHAFRNAQKRFEKLLVADVVKLCRQHNCGEVVYREPSKPARNISWFAKRDVPFNWTNIASGLRWKCEVHGIDLKTDVWKYAQQKERNNAKAS